MLPLFHANARRLHKEREEQIERRQGITAGRGSPAFGGDGGPGPEASYLLLTLPPPPLPPGEGRKMAKKPMTLAEAADELGVHYMTVYRYVRTGRLPATRVGGVWQVDPGHLALVRRPEPGARSRRPSGAKASPAQLEARLVAGDETGAWNLLEAALGSDMTPSEVLLELVSPALRTIGTRWQRGDLSVADEHRSSAVAARLISRLGARFAPAASSGGPSSWPPRPASSTGRRWPSPPTCCAGGASTWSS